MHTYIYTHTPLHTHTTTSAVNPLCFLTCIQEAGAPDPAEPSVPHEASNFTSLSLQQVVFSLTLAPR